MTRIFSGFCLLLAILASLSNACAETRFALVIGNADYAKSTPTFSNLTHALRDAQAIADFLTEKGNFKTEFLPNASRDEMIHAIDNFMKRLKAAGADGVGLVYYAGHGVQIEDKSYLIPSKEVITSRAAAKSRAYPLDEIIDHFAQAQNRLNLLIVDACRNDPFTMGGGGGLVVKEAPQGLILAYSAGSGRVAEDGLFTPVLLQHMGTPNVPIDKVLRRTRDEIDTRNPLQLPSINDRAKNSDAWTMILPGPQPIIGKSRYGWLGIVVGEVTLGIAQAVGLDQARGVKVLQVAKSGPAERGGIRAGDVITKIGAQEIKDDKAFVIDVQEKLPVGKALEVEILRGRNRQRFTVVPDGMTEVQTQYYTGVKYDRGWNIVQNYHEAFQWFRKAAEQGNARAQFKVGEMYDNGNGVAQDKQEAVRWYRKAAEQGDTEGQYSLGWMYSKGEGVSQDKQEAVRWYRKAAEQGDADGQYSLGVMYSKGEGVSQDKQEAVRWYRKAAEQGHADGQYSLGWMYSEGEGVSQDKQEAVRWYRKAAEQGDADGQYGLGVMYSKGEGVSQDKQEAVRWYRKAAEQGHADGQYSLGVMYSKGEGVSQDKQEAVRWYRKAAEQGHADGQYGLGWMYSKGEGVSQDKQEAVRWYRKAAEQGHANAQKALEALQRR